jgi:hypothetical protein
LKLSTPLGASWFQEIKEMLIPQTTFFAKALVSSVDRQDRQDIVDIMVECLNLVTTGADNWNWNFAEVN